MVNKKTSNTISQLQEHLSFIKQILDSIDRAIIATTLKGEIIFWNSAAEQLYKWKTDDVIGKNIVNITPSAASKAQAQQIMESLEKGESWKGEFEVQDKNGREFYIEVSDSPLYDDKNNLIGIIGISHDITNERKKRLELLQNEEKFRSLYHSTPLPYQSLNEDGSFKDVNEAWLTVLGYKRDEVIGKYYRDFLHPDWQNHFDKNFPAFKKRGYVHDVQFKIKHKKGHFIDISFEGCIGYHPDGSFKQTYCVFQDITKRKKAEVELLEREAHYRQLVETASDAIFLTNDKGIIVNTNEVATKMLGKPRNEIIGQTIDKIDPNYPIEKFIEFWKDKPPGKPYVFETTHITNNNKLIPVEISGNKFMVNNDVFYLGIARDISERKKEQELIKDSERKFRILADNTNDWEYWINENGEYVFISNSIEKISGYSVDEFLKKPDFLFEIVCEKDKKRIQEHYSYSTEYNYPEHKTEFRIKHKNGKQVWIEHHCIPIFDDEGKFLGRRGNNRDITIRKSHELELVKEKENALENQQLFESFFLSNPTATFVWRKTEENFVLTRVNEKALKITDGKAKNFVGLTATEIYSDLPFISEKIKECFSEGKTLEFEHLYETRYSGNQEWVKFKLAKIEPNKVLMYTETITRQKKFEEEIIKAKEKAEENERDLKEAQEISQVGSWKYDVKTKTPVWSDEMFRIWGINDKSEIPDYNDHKKYIHPDDWELFDTSVKEAIEKKQPYKLELRIIRPDGEKRNIITIGKHFTDNEGNVIELRGTNQDITERKKIETELENAKNKAEESERLKSAFLANMSHEIRTPMNGIMGFLEILQSTDVNEEEEEKYLDIIKKSGDRLLTTINDIIQISRIESEQVKVFNEEFYLHEIMEYFEVFFSKEANEKGIEFKTSCNCKMVEEKLFTDKNKLESILTNLIKNAIKFTHKGEVTCSCTADNDFVKFEVKDTGIGIPKERLNFIFDRFVQADLNITRGYEGSGLGLSIVKAYVEMLGGKIWVASEPGKGSTFYFTIKRETLTQAPKAPEYMIDAKATGKKELVNILVAEDEDIGYSLIKTILKQEGYLTQRAVNGVEAVSMFNSNPDFDLILMDLKMPLMDGIEATRQIRILDENVPIIAQTAFAFPVDKKQALEAGCNDFISKPIIKKDFLEKIRKFLS